MIGTQIKSMLEAEMKVSDEFSNRNFGLSVGDDFREIVEEALQSRKIAATLAVNTLVAALGAPKLGTWMQANAAGQNEDDYVGKAILANFEAFKVPMEFLYWGIQVGRKLAQEETDALKKLETADSGQ
jgi:hypothetical protein